MLPMGFLANGDTTGRNRIAILNEKVAVQRQMEKNPSVFSVMLKKPAEEEEKPWQSF